MSNWIIFREVALDLRRQLTATQAELAALKAQEPVQVDYVAVMRADGDGGLEVEWLLEGGTAELMNGMYLCCVGGGTLLFEEGSGQLYAAPVSEAKAQGVVMPERQVVEGAYGYDLGGNYGEGYSEGWNDCIDEFARLNGAAMTNTINVPRELLENIVLCYNEGEFELGTLAAECHALLSAPSSANHVEDVRAMVDAPAAPAADACKACKGTGRRPIGGRGRIFGLTNRCFECQPLTDEEVYGQVTAHE